MCTVLGNLETNYVSDAVTTLVNTCRIIQKSQVSVEQCITAFIASRLCYELITLKQIFIYLNIVYVMIYHNAISNSERVLTYC